MCEISNRGQRKRTGGGWRWVVPVAAILAGRAAMGVTVLDFEDLSAGTTVTAQYGPRGVLFQQAFLDTDPNAHSGTHVLRTVNPSAEIFTPVPLVMTFTSAQARVKLFADSPGAALNGALTAFDAGGNVVATDGPKLVAADVFTTVFEVTVASPTIMRAELQVEGSAHQAIDDLEFDGQPPATVPTTPPVVAITSPANGAELDVSTIDITGTVTGDGLLSPVTVTISFLRPPGSTAPPITNDLSLTGTGTTRQFALTGFTGVPLGPVTITATAENTGALKGTASITFDNLPGGIRDRFQAQGGAAVLGAFQFGLFLNGCKIAVYEHGAITDTKLFIGGDIFTKWLSLKGPFGIETGFFGCPLADATSGPNGSTEQRFTGGLIYSNIPGGPFYVPDVFVQAIAQRGGELANGIPLADPSSSAGALQTWLFQQFTRPDRPDLLPSTLEIRGTPPTLWMERQGGDLTLPTEPSATLWESFTCSGNLGPCNVEPQPGPPIPINEPAQFCGFDTYSPINIGGPPEWKAIVGDYVSTSIFGVIVSAFYADIDNALTHEFSFGGCKDCPDTIGGATTPIGGLCPDCPSDYEFKVHPIGPQAHPIAPPTGLPYPSLLAPSNPDNLKIEYELYYASAAHAFLDAPQTGDLAFVTGRWIIDCGHDSFKSELHPVFSFGKMRTLNTITDPFTGLVQDVTGGKPATRADIWVNGWYPGGDNNAIEFDVFPPPRPSPDAVLHVIKPVDFVAGDNNYIAAQDVNLEFILEPAGAASHVHMRFTSPLRQNDVTDDGEMMFETGRQYWGMWFVFWGQ